MTIHCLENLIFPFTWPHPIIYTLPESLIPLMESPLPIIVGLNSSVDFVFSSNMENKYSNCVFVFLDKMDKLMCCEQIKEKI